MTSAQVPEGNSVDSSDIEGAELVRLQSRLDELSARIKDAVPEGYDLNALIKASGEGHETENVFDITSEQEALIGLTGPLNVPGNSPPPAFQLEEAELKAMERAEAAHESVRRRGMWLFAIVLVVLVAAIIGLVVVLPAL